MLTPKFEVKQNETHITVKIFAPYTKITDAKVSMVEDVFTFYSSPYYLRLSFSGKLVDSEYEDYSATFDSDAGAFTITCKKETPGEQFANLDMLTRLLAPKGATGVNRPTIEVINGCDSEDDEDFDFTYEQTLPQGNTVTKGYKYGFGNTSTNVFSALQNELTDVIDIKDPDNKSPPQRREERMAQEVNLFDEEHYLADYYDTDMTQQYIEFIPEFYSVSSDEVDFSEEDKEDMLQLPRKEHLLDSGTKSLVFLGLADILYAWCYNHRITMGGYCAESAWNVAKLSSTLSCLDSFTSLKDVAISCVRRSLVFPLIRNWTLSQQVLKDTAHVLSLGRKKVLKCLLEIRRFFNSTETKYILNELYINDYCVWLQRVKEEKFISFGDSLRKVWITKADVDLDLDDLHMTAEVFKRKEEAEQNMNSCIIDLAGLTVIENGAVLGDGTSDTLSDELPTTITEQRELLPHLSDSDSSSSDSDSDEESDDTSDSSDSSDDSSDDSDGESSTDSSDLDSDDDTPSEKCGT